jgi:hypothetical protein
MLDRIGRTVADFGCSLALCDRVTGAIGCRWVMTPMPGE